MKNKSKTNWKIDENTTEKFNRYGIRKYNVGAASVAILSGLFFLGGADAQAAETGSSQTAAQAVATESGSGATANTWEKAITTVVEKEKSTNVAATGTENKPVDTVAPKAVEAQTTPKETVATAPKAETREANAGRGLFLVQKDIVDLELQEDVDQAVQRRVNRQIIQRQHLLIQ